MEKSLFFATNEAPEEISSVEDIQLVPMHDTAEGAIGWAEDAIRQACFCPWDESQEPAAFYVYEVRLVRKISVADAVLLSNQH
jgi:hypothetical protein